MFQSTQGVYDDFWHREWPSSRYFSVLWADTTAKLVKLPNRNGKKQPIKMPRKPEQVGKWLSCLKKKEQQQKYHLSEIFLKISKTVLPVVGGGL